MERVRRQHVLLVRWFLDGLRHIIAERPVLFPVRFDRALMLSLVAQVLEQSPTDHLVDFQALDGELHLFAPPKHLLQRLVRPLGT